MQESIRIFLLVFFLAMMLYVAIRLGLGHYSKKHDWKLNFKGLGWQKKTEQKVEEKPKEKEPTEEETKAKLDTYQEL